MKYPFFPLLDPCAHQVTAWQLQPTERLLLTPCGIAWCASSCLSDWKSSCCSSCRHMAGHLCGYCSVPHKTFLSETLWVVHIFCIDKASSALECALPTCASSYSSNQPVHHTPRRLQRCALFHSAANRSAHAWKSLCIHCTWCFQCHETSACGLCSRGLALHFHTGRKPSCWPS